MQRQNMGDSMGKVDSDGIAEWYPNCKVRFDGSHYIATPHTTNSAKRNKQKEEIITVSEQDGKITLESNLDNADEPKKSVRSTTRKELFDELYDKYAYLKPKERKKAVYADIQPIFKDETELEIFMEENSYRRWRNVVERRKRFARKAYNQNFQWFATFTYSDEKHTEESFKKRLLETLRRLATRHKWRYMGVWERGKDTDRLHFHALVKIPDGELVGSFEEKADYNRKTGKQKTFTQNTFFADRFGRNEFDVICNSPESYGKAIAYIMKYMEKQNARAVYSRGLYDYFRSDIQGKDVLCNTNIFNETDNRLILADDFTCWDNGALIGEVCEETIAKLPKSV